MPDRKNTPVLVMAALVTVVACVLAWSSGAFGAENLWDLQRNLMQIGSSIHVPLAVTLLVGAMCYARTRSRAILWLTLASVVVNALATTLIIFAPEAIHFGPGSLSYKLLYALTFLTRSSTAVPAIVLLSLRFRGRLERLRLASLMVMGVMVASEVLAVWTLEMPLWERRTVSVAETLLLMATIAAGAGVAWATAFGQLEQPHRPPADARWTVSLTCPRCNRPQMLAMPADECRDCRLRIYVTVEEGACGACGHSLDGITGDTCPKCGKPLSGAVAG